MVDRPLVSILMPTHSRVDVIAFAIQSVLRQTISDFELLIVGDGCAPGTADVIAAFNDDRIRFFDLPKAPYFGYANRNIALREAKGTFIGFAADDDLLLPDHLELLLKSLDGGAAIAYSQAIWISTDGIAAPFLTNLGMADELENFMKRENTIPASCFLYRADSLPHLDAWREDVPSAADWRLWHRIIRENNVNPVPYCRSPTVMHFSARWKNSRFSSMHQFGTLIFIADAVNWWPEALRVEINKGETEQEAYSLQLAADPAGWTAAVRLAANDLVARIALDDLQIVRPILAQTSDKLAAAQRDLVLERSELASERARANLAEKQIEMLKSEHESTMAEQQNLRRELELRQLFVEAQTSELEEIKRSMVWRVQRALHRAAHTMRRRHA